VTHVQCATSFACYGLDSWPLMMQMQCSATGKRLQSHSSTTLLLLQAIPAEVALLLVCSLLSSQELLCVTPLVSKAFGAAAAAALGSRSFSVTSFQVGSSKAASLALWMQRHSAVLAHVQLCGFKSGVSSAWWDSICSAPFSSLQVSRNATLHCLRFAVPHDCRAVCVHVRSVQSTQQPQLPSAVQQAHTTCR
jgi:hypothetical protein